MTRHLRLLGAADSSADNSTAAVYPAPITINSDFIVILAALLCALICVLGLTAVARCAWLRRFSSSASASGHSQHPPTPSKANKGLKKKILRSLPKLTITPDSAAKYSDCAICLSEFTAGDEIRVLPHCGHAFHVACVDKWLGSHSSCPSCRHILVAAGGRCEKCGNLPASSSSNSNSNSNANSSEAEARLKQIEDGANTFLP